MDVTLPSFGETMSEAVVVEWLVAEGEAVAADQPLVVVETDKVDAEVVAPAAGRLAEIVAEARETVQVGAALARLDTT